MTGLFLEKAAELPRFGNVRTPRRFASDSPKPDQPQWAESVLEAEAAKSASRCEASSSLW